MRSTDGYFFAVRHGEDDELRVQVRLLFVFGSQTTDGGRKPKKNKLFRENTTLLRWVYARGGCGITSTKILKDFTGSDEIIQINK